MTPTLVGRWQTRVFLLGTVGNFITFFFAVLALLLSGEIFDFFKPFILLFFVVFLGFFWDIIYNLLQKLRWDRDWPPAFSFAVGFIELFPILIIGWLINVPFLLLLFHYGTVWWAVFIMSLGPMRVIFPRWRFFGGRWL